MTRCIRTDAFISWDRFKEISFGLELRERRPINSDARFLFATVLLEENGRAPLFTRMIPAEYSGHSRNFRNTLLSILPRLKYFLESEPVREGRLDPALIADYHLIYKRYLDFLDANGFFEPSWIDTDNRISGEYTILFPELISDFNDFRTMLADNPAVGLFSPMPKERVCLMFSDERSELNWVLSEIRRLLDAGTSCSDIALTFPAPEISAVMLERMARFHSVPLIFTAGRALSDVPGGRLLRHLQNSTEEDYSLDSLKVLLLDPKIPWKSGAAIHELISFGVEAGCFRNIRTRRQRTNIWRKALKARNAVELTAFYHKIEYSFDGLVEAEDFADLRRKMQAFSHEWLDTDAWEEDYLRSYQSILEKLGALDTLQKELQLKPAERPFTLWLKVLEKTRYVPAGDRLGIQVYPYRVAAGIEAKHHFICCASRENTGVGRSDYPFLREDEKSLFPASEHDDSEAFTEAYTVSGGKVVFTAARDSWSGPALPGAYFLAHNAVVTAPPELRRNNRGPLFAETDFWTGASADFPAALSKEQREGFMRSTAVADLRRGIDFDAERQEDRTIPTGWLTESAFAVSATSLHTFLNCPFAFLLERTLQRREQDWTITLFDHRVFGNIQHEIVQRIFRELQEADAPTPSDSGILMQAAEIHATALFQKMERRHEVPFPPVWNDMKNRAMTNVRRFIEVECAVNSGWRTVGMEYAREIPLAPGLQLKGRLDRLARTSDRAAIVDYKSSKRQDPKDAALRSSKAGLQAITYMYLIRDAFEITDVSFYAFREGVYQPVMRPGKKGWFAERSIEALFDEFEDLVRCMYDRILRGDFQSSGNEECQYCRYRTICRLKYAVR